jgi:N-acetylneuraminic acid mutarotase
MSRVSKCMILAVSLAALGACDEGPLPSAPGAPRSGTHSLNEPPDTWSKRGDLPAARSSLTAAAVNGTVYAIGGFRDSAEATVTAYNTNLLLASWQSRASMPGRRYNTSGATAINGKIYVPGGYNKFGLPTSSLYVYNAGTNNWATKAPTPGPSAQGASGAIGGKLYLFSPELQIEGGPSQPRRFHRYDPAADSWQPLPAPPNEHIAGAAAVINGKFYLVGGYTLESITPTGILDVYNPGTNSWQTKATAPTGRYQAAARALGGKLYLVGGSGASGTLDGLDVYDPGSNSWSTMTDMPTPRAGLGAAVANGKLWIVGGTNPKGVSKAYEVYTP